MDLIIALLAAFLLSPLLLIVAGLVYINLGSPVLFRQRRPGLGGRLFTLFKFRSMPDAFDSSGKLLPDEKRLTAFGSFLRATSLDELPELYNVLKGDMSLVGPRPLLVEYLDLYTAEQARRHSMRPGVTGLAQISGRNAAAWPKRLRLDVWYTDHWSIRLDIYILWMTLWKVIKREGVTQPGRVTVDCFEGTGRVGNGK